MSSACTSRRGRKAVDPELALNSNIAARAAALRAGKKMPPLELPPVDLPGIALNVRATTGRKDFRSVPEAKAMSQGDICNVQLLSREDAKDILDAIRLVAPEFVDAVIERIDNEWSPLLDSAERFTLSAYAARKYAKQG